MTTSKLRVLAGAAILVAGCAGHDDEQGTATTTAAMAPSPTTVESPPLPNPAPEVYATLESRPECPDVARSTCLGGYLLREVNREEVRHVARLDFSALPLAAIEQASPGWTDLLLLGRFAGEGPRSEASSFVVAGVWRGLPGISPEERDRYFTIEVRDDQLFARTLNRGGELSTGAVDVSEFAPPFVDTAWLTSRVLEYGAIVAGRFDERTLEADQVFVRLPDVAGPCPLFRLFCGSGTETFDRTINRCLVPTGCVSGRHVCPLYVPVCEQGYKLVMWPSEPDGCLAYACDPAFLSQ